MSDVFDDPFEENNDDDLGEEIASIMEDNIVEQEESSLKIEQVDIDTTEDDANEEPSPEHLAELLDEEESYADLSDINVQDDDTFEHNHSEENIIGIEDLKTEKENISDLEMQLFPYKMNRIMKIKIN